MRIELAVALGKFRFTRSNFGHAHHSGKVESAKTDVGTQIKNIHAMGAAGYGEP